MRPRPLTPAQKQAALDYVRRDNRPRRDIPEDSWRYWGYSDAYERCEGCLSHEEDCERCFQLTDPCPITEVQCDRCRAADAAKAARGELFDIEGLRAGIRVRTWDGREGVIPWSALDVGIQCSLLDEVPS